MPILTLGLLNGFAFLAQLRLVNMLGVIVAAAFSIGFVILDIVDTALWGLGGAPAIMVGQSLGARKPKRAREVAYKAAVLIFALMMIAACLIYPIRRNVADIFADNPQILDESDMLLQFLLPTLPFFGLYIVAMSTGRGSGHTSFPTTIGILRLWGIRIGLGYFLALTLGIGPIGVWLAISLSNVVGGIIAILWIRYGKWAEAIVKSEGS